MQILIDKFATSMKTTFDGKTVGNGGDFGSALSKGPFTIHTGFHQWQNIEYPCIHLQIIQESFLGEPLECCGGGVHSLSFDIRISSDSKTQGYSIAAALHEAVREWLCEISGTDTLKSDDYSYTASIQTPDSNYVPEEGIFSIHVIGKIFYVRQEKGSSP